MTDQTPTADPASPPDEEPARKILPAAAQRALEEAAARRAARDAETAQLNRAAEIHGREGPEPVRYGDWENKGIASDF